MVKGATVNREGKGRVGVVRGCKGEAKWMGR